MQWAKAVTTTSPRRASASADGGRRKPPGGNNEKQERHNNRRIDTSQLRGSETACKVVDSSLILHPGFQTNANAALAAAGETVLHDVGGQCGKSDDFEVVEDHISSVFVESGR